MKIEIWSDVMCPFCYLGKKNLETALAQFSDSDKIEVDWKSYQLDPSIPENVHDTYSGYLSKKRNVSEARGNEMLATITASAKKVGLDYHFDKTVMTSSYKAHLLIQFAKSKGLGGLMEERLFRAFFTEGKNVSDITILTDLGKEIGLDEVELQAAFTDEIYAYNVKNDINKAVKIGVSGVPFFVFDRKYAISGAQPPQVFLEVLEKSYSIWKEKNKKTDLDITNGQSCSIDGKCE